MTQVNQILFDTPARDFTESLLIGNGRLGACVYGEVLREQLILNESSMWSGSLEESDRPGAAAHLPEIRRLLREGKHAEAQKLFGEHFTCKGPGTNYAHGTDVPFGCYQMLGRLMISYFQAVSSGRQDTCCLEDYRRTLNLEHAAASVSFSLGGRKYTREYLVSADYQAICVHLTCTEKGQIDFTCGLDRDECFAVEPLSRTSSEEVPCGLFMHGQLADGHGTHQGIHYGCALAVTATGGQIMQEPLRVRVTGADEAWIILTARTDLSGFMGRESCDPRSLALSDLKAACEAGWDTILQKHLDWYVPQYKKMELSFGTKNNCPAETVTTKELLISSAEGEPDPALISLYVQYARYLMICSSVPDGLPANLQGIWSDEILTPWNGDWHLNAQQMIYWLVEKANLSSCHIPYLKLTGELVKPGEKTAQTYYGARGWLAHTCTNPWGFTSPCEDASWGSTTGSPAWQCHHLWEHYLYDPDPQYLAWAYPVMKGAMLFYLDNMVEDEDGYLITSPSSSPENWFLDENGDQCALCEGPTYDRALILSLTEACIQAGMILGTDMEFTEELRQTRQKLAPIRIGSDGRIMEWSKEYQEPFPYHRHLSHLWGVYPGNLLSREKTPDYGKAAEKSLAARSMTTAGWAIAYRGCLQARLRNGDQALTCFRYALKYATAYNLMNLAYHCDETLTDPPGLDLNHCRYPFQIDGNQGNAAIILLMLLDDDVEFLEDHTMVTHLYLLPALPQSLFCGSIRGLRGKGSLTIDMDWENGRITFLTIHGPSGKRVVLHEKGTTQNITLQEQPFTIQRPCS
ncbi:MAG: glycoside hydrolase family 95 protein [Lachnospiraceae bacterium]|nr:glycoside hydrolase family 95 protein [Lachnospiraceae bacterium]